MKKKTHKSIHTKKSKLLSSIGILNLSQRRDLKQFMNMSSNKLTIRDKDILCCILETNIAKLNAKGENIWNELLLPQERRNKNRIKTRILRVIEKYICILGIESNEPLKHLLLTNFYTKKQVLKNVETTLKKGIKNLEKTDSFNLRDQVVLFWLYEFQVSMEKDIRKQDNKINLMESLLQDLYSCNRIRIICERINRQKIINDPIDLTSYLSEVEDIIRKTDSVHAKAYYNIFHLITSGKEIYYDELDHYVQYFEGSLGIEYLKEFYLHLMNYCIRQFNAGDFNYILKYFNYIKLLESRKMLLDNGVIGISRFKNIVLASIILRKKKWAIEFMDKYAVSLPETKKISRESFLTLNRAIVELFSKNLEKCLKHIQEFQNSDMYHKDVYYKITCDKLLVKVYFGLNDMEACITKARGIRQYIRSRKNLLKGRKVKHLNFLLILERLTNNRNVDLSDYKDKLLIPDILWFKIIRKEWPV